MIQELPDLPFELILGNLSYEDRFSLRRTCKKLKSLVDGQVYRIRFVFLNCYPCHKYLFPTNELVYYPYSCRIPHLSHFGRFISSKSKESFLRLRKLAIYFEGLSKLKDYHKFIEVDWKHVKNQSFFREVWHLNINLDDLNFFEHLEHLEIKGIGKVVGQLKLKNLRILSVKTRRLSEFNLHCKQLRAMRISLGARPNFITPSINNHLDCLSTGPLLFANIYYYLFKLCEQCPNLSTIAFEHPEFLEFILWQINDNHLQLPLLRVIKFEGPQYGPSKRMIEGLVQYEKSLEPECLQFFFFDQPISLEQFASIIQDAKKFGALEDKPDLTFESYVKYLIENESSADLSCLFYTVYRLYAGKDHVELSKFDEDLVMKLKKLESFVIISESSRIDEVLFRKMLTTWTKLDELYIDDPAKVVGQHLLEQMPSYWPNLHFLRLTKRPDNLKFVAEFKNLRYFLFDLWLPREDTMSLFQTCPSLYYISLGNESTGFRTLFSTNIHTTNDIFISQSLPKFILNRKQYTLSHYHPDDEPSKDLTLLFPSLEKMIDHFYQNEDLSNDKSIARKIDKLLIWLSKKT